MKTLVLSALVLLAGCSVPAVPAVPSAAASSEWDAAATAELTTVDAGMLQKVDAGDFDGLRTSSDKETFVMFDTDANNAPVQMYTKAESDAYMQAAKEMVKQGLKLQSKVVKHECHATQAIGFCTTEFDQSITLPDGKAMGPFKFRASSVHRKVGTEWKSVHFHGSSREVATAATSAPAK